MQHSSYMEHGYCLNWETPLLVLHVGSDIVTGIAYYSIPLAMFYFAYRRRDMPFLKIFIMFALFILSCGTTHFLGAYTIYQPYYWAEGYAKACTAVISALTAVIFIPRIPDAIALPSIIDSVAEINKLNRELGIKNRELQLANFSIENMLDSVYWVSRDARVQRVNAAACKTLGYTAEEMLQLTVADLDPLFPVQLWPSHWDELKEKKSMVLESKHRTKNGELFDVEVCANYLVYEGQELSCAIVRDITSRKRAERELRANESRMASLYNISQHPFTNEPEFLDHALREIVSLTDSRIGYIYSYNEQSRQFILTNQVDDAANGSPPPDRKTRYDLASIGIWGEAVSQRRPILLNELKGHPKAGFPEHGVAQWQEALARVVAVPVLVDEAIVAVVAVANKGEDYTELDLMQLKLFTDSVWMITMRKRAEEERISLERQLLHAQKLESLGVLAGGIAHDFNNILMSILGNTDLAIMKLPPESPLSGYLHAIERGVERAADLAKQMLAYSGKGKFLVESVDINQLLEEMLHMLQVSISKKAVLRFDPGSQLPAVEADATQLRQVVMNLVINASESLGENSGIIAISTGWMDCDPAYLKNIKLDDTIAEGTYVYLEVSDTGCGMDSETISKMFDPFFTTKFTGRGLGMAAVMGIMRGHRGAIKVYSEVDRGTAFKLFFPASGPAPDAASLDQSRDAWRGKGTVLLVDDEETVRETGGKMLRELGFEVLTAADGLQALAVFGAHTQISFVVLDLTMPQMDGEQCFRELRKLDPQVRVIMSSGYNEREVTQRFVGKGLAGFIQKPYKLSVLKRVIMELE